MTPDDDLQLIQCSATAIPIPDESVQCIVTSPPYWGLRKYSGKQELIWMPWPIGAELGLPPGSRMCELCEHEWGEWIIKNATNHTDSRRWNHTRNGRDELQPKEKRVAWLRTDVAQGKSCRKCAAWYGAFGLEPEIEMYIQHSIEVLRELRRILRPDGVLFWNIGDSYQSGNRGTYQRSRIVSNKSLAYGKHQEPDRAPNRFPQIGLKPKDLCLIPSRVAIAAQSDGWWVRSMIVWAKPNPMPESCKDRPTDSYEYIIMLTKSGKYFWDFDKMQEPCSEGRHMRVSQDVAKQIGSLRVPGKTNGNMKAVVRGGVHPKAEAVDPGDHHFGPKANQSFSASVCLPVLTRNVRNFWDFTTQGYKEGHFATFPEELPRRCILAASKAGDTILDPFAGSGTTGKVAIELGRRAILVDLAYQNLAKKRLREIQRPLIIP